MNGAVVIVGAHPDDEVLGCGGTAARWAAEGRAVHILLMADGETSRSADATPSTGQAKVQARNAAAYRACEILGSTSVEILALPDNRLDTLDLLSIVQAVEVFVEKHQPATVLTHHSGDVNVDHRIVHDAVVVACRPQPDHPVKELLFFEAASSTEWRPPASGLPFNPNYFVDISATMDKKLAALRAYGSELRQFPHPRSLQAVAALAQWRGATVGVHAAEAFELGRRLVC
jgi:LmbE family N-acetylglucosaminyl deacetylase